MTNPVPSRVLPPFTDVRLTYIKPLEKTAHVETIDPGPFDTHYPEMFIPTLSAYRLAGKSDAIYSAAVKRMRESLSKVLIPFFTFAGRWVAAPPGSAGRRLLCNDAGVPFIEARVDVALDSVVASAAFQPVPELNGYEYVGMDSTQFAQALPPDGVPSVFVQVTRFNCGGMVACLTYNHMNVDGRGLLTFVRAWSELARTNQTAVKVDHNRAQLRLPSGLTNFGDLNATDHPNGPKKLGLWGMKTLEVGPLTIQALKEQARQDGAGPGYVSREDCIVAQLIKSVQRLTTSVLAQEEVVVTRVVEGRNLFFDSPVPDVSANVFTFFVQPEIACSELLEMPLASIARRLRKQKDSMKTEDWLGSAGMGKYVEAVEMKKMKNFAVSSLLGFGVYGIDFGFGDPYFVGGPNFYASLESGAMMALAVCTPAIRGSFSSVATVHILASPDVLQALESDPEFHQFFLPQYRTVGRNVLSAPIFSAL